MAPHLGLTDQSGKTTAPQLANSSSTLTATQHPGSANEATISNTPASETGKNNSKANETQSSNTLPSQTFTLEPYKGSSFFGQGGKTSEHRSRQRNNRTNRERMQPNFPPLIGTNEASDNKRFFILQSAEANQPPLWKVIDTIKANRELLNLLKGRPKRISELRNGDILIEVANNDQSNRIRQIQKLNGHKINVSEHKTLNYTKGTIHSKRFCELDETSLIEELSQSQVTDIYKMKRKENGNLVNTGTMILTFAHYCLPKQVFIGWTSFEVREYIPNPRRCYKCQNYGHGTKACRSEEDRCANCGTSGHTDPNCLNPTNCYHCDEAHPTYSKKCSMYKQEKEIITVMTREKVNYPEAKKKLGIPPQPRKTYARALLPDANKTPNPPQIRQIIPRDPDGPKAKKRVLSDDETELSQNSIGKRNAPNSELFVPNTLDLDGNSSQQDNQQEHPMSVPPPASLTGSLATPVAYAGGDLTPRPPLSAPKINDPQTQTKQNSRADSTKEREKSSEKKSPSTQPIDTNPTLSSKEEFRKIPTTYGKLPPRPRESRSSHRDPRHARSQSTHKYPPHS